MSTNTQSFDDFCHAQLARVAAIGGNARSISRRRVQRTQESRKRNERWVLEIRGHRPAQIALDEAPQLSRSGATVRED